MEKNVLLAICLAAILLTVGCNNPAGGAKDIAVGNIVKPDDKSVSGQDVPDEVKSLFSGRPVQYMVEYASTVLINNEPSTGIYAYYFRGDQTRIDIYISGMESRYYTDKDGAVLCNLQGVKWSCTNLKDERNQPTEQDPVKGMDELKKNVEENKATRLPDRVIAGVTCKCFKMKIDINIPNAKQTGMSGIESTDCLSPEGVPLLIETTTESMHSIMEATKYSTTVTDADFTPPVQPQTMEAALGGGTPLDQQLEEMLSAEDKETQCGSCDKMPTNESAQECRMTFGC